jgi:hypothetical protein
VTISTKFRKVCLFKWAQLINRLSQSAQSFQSDVRHFPSAAVVAIDMHQPSIEQQIVPHLAYDITRGARDIIGKSP